MTRDQIAAKLRDRNLSDHEREKLHQYLHYLDAEGISGAASPSRAKRPAQKNKRNYNAGKAKSTPSQS